MTGPEGQFAGWKTGAWRFALPAAAVLACAAILWAVAGGSSHMGGETGGHWLGRALTSRLFVLCAGVSLACGLLLAAIGAALWRVVGRRRWRMADESGTAMLEFALVLPVALTLVLLMIQSSVLMGGNLAVHYAAYCAARSAIVNVPADRSPTEGPNVVIEPSASGKLRRMKLSAIWAVMPVSCSSSDMSPAPAVELIEGIDGLFAQYGVKTPGWVRAHLGRKLRYAEDYTQVYLAGQKNGETYEQHEKLRATVVHTFYLSVPYSNWTFKALAGDDGVDLDFGEGQLGHYGLIMRAQCTLANQGVRDYIDVETFPN